MGEVMAANNPVAKNTLLYIQDDYMKLNTIRYILVRLKVRPSEYDV